MVTEIQAIELARNALIKEGVNILNDTGKALYRERKLAIGDEKKGWVVSFSLNTEGVQLDPDIVFVHVSDPDAKLYIPNIM